MAEVSSKSRRMQQRISETASTIRCCPRRASNPRCVRWREPPDSPASTAVRLDNPTPSPQSARRTRSMPTLVASTS
ncbi:uncharacterized protein BJX67DRAFT_359019 [Aspergillus lucknowensis]|uniref:Uncharacterized protein n=1 Tax=Aspergillus lucknowensis TaxID=176173 RepID=A0ABR4LM55_9EURO